MLHISYLKKVHTEKISWRNCMINTYLHMTKSQHFTTMILWLHFLNLLNHFKIYWTHILSLNIYIKIIFSNIMTSLSHPRKLMIFYILPNIRLYLYFHNSSSKCLNSCLLFFPNQDLVWVVDVLLPDSVGTCFEQSWIDWLFAGAVGWGRALWKAGNSLVRKGSGPGGSALDWGLTKSKGNSVIFLIFF